MYEILNAFSPRKLLKRGFALITDESGNSIYTIKNVNENDKLIVKFCDGKIIAGAQEERFSRIKHDHHFPEKSIKPMAPP